MSKDLDGAALAAAFRERRPDLDHPALGEALAGLVRAAQEAWPGLGLSPEDFARALAAASGEGLECVRAPDLYLARACLSKEPAALRLLEERVLPKAAEAVRRLDPSSAFVSEVLQLVRQRLLLGEEDGRPRLAEYGGQGSLANWVRAVALRVGLNLRRARAREVPTEDEVLAELPSAEDDLDLAHLRRQHRADFAAAFQQSLAQLSARERNVLRLNLVDGLNIERIGALYGVHRSTVARWIAQAKEELAKSTRKALAVRLGLSAGELDSLMRQVESRLDVSINRFLCEA